VAPFCNPYISQNIPPRNKGANMKKHFKAYLKLVASLDKFLTFCGYYISLSQNGTHPSGIKLIWML
jgi:hypothetical protein